MSLSIDKLLKKMKSNMQVHCLLTNGMITTEIIIAQKRIIQDK